MRDVVATAPRASFMCQLSTAGATFTARYAVNSVPITAGYMVPACRKTPADVGSARGGFLTASRCLSHPSACVENEGSSMITLLERRSLPAAESAVSGSWIREVQGPSIQRDGATYDANLDRFIADLPLNGVRSKHSLRSYAYDLLVWVRFLDEACGKTVWQATREDVDAYHRARRHDEALNRISAASWNRAVAALDKLYRWAVEDGIIAQSPFTYRDVWRRMPSRRGRTITVSRNQAYERAAKRSDVKFITIEDHRRFRDVGLQGLAADGGERPGARDRNGSRNALFADLLITTGLRLEEASSLLAIEIEEAIRGSADGDRQVAFRLPAALTKGDKGRTIRIPASPLSRLRSYLEVERVAAIEKFRMRGGIKRMPATLTCAINAGRIQVTTASGERRPMRLDTVSPDERRRLVIHGNDGTPLQPAALWLSEVGLPQPPHRRPTAPLYPGRASARRCRRSPPLSRAHAVRRARAAAVEGTVGVPGRRRTPDQRREQDAPPARRGHRTSAQVVAQVHHGLFDRYPGRPHRA